LAVIKLLSKGEFCVSDLVTELKMPQSKVSLILKDLRDLDLVSVVGLGKRRFYNINRIVFDKYLSDIKKMLSDFEANGSNEIIVRRKVLFSN